MRDVKDGGVVRRTGCVRVGRAIVIRGGHREGRKRKKERRMEKG